MNFRKISLGLLFFAVAGVLLWQVTRRHAPDVTRARPATKTTETAPARAPEPVAPQASPVPEPVAPTLAPVASASSPTSLPMAPAAVVADSPQPTTEPTVTPPASADAELQATARMYAAHASLRTPEVADPDSVTNRQILGTMVAKALAQPATPPAKSTR